MKSGQPLVWTRAQDERLMELMSHDWPVSQIARDLGVTRHAVWGRFKRLNAAAGYQFS